MADQKLPTGFSWINSATEAGKRAITPIQLANALDELAENPKGGKMAAIAYRQAAKFIRTKLVDPATEDAQRAEHLRNLLRRAISYGGIEPQLDQEIKDALRVPCRVCGGSGFAGYGTGYDAVCGECGGQQFEELAHADESRK